MSSTDREGLSSSQLLDMRSLVASISTRFISLPVSKFDSAILESLKQIGLFADVDKSYVFLFTNGCQRMSNSHYWSRLIKKQSQFAQVDLDLFPWFKSKINQLEIIHVPSLDTLSSEAEAELREFRAQGIKSLINVPMVKEGKLIGFLGFDSFQQEKKWGEEDILLLRMVAEIFVHAIERQRSDSALNAAEHETKKLQEQLVQSQKMSSVGQLAAGLAHDLNNALSVVVGHLEIVNHRSDIPETIKAPIASALDGCSKVTAITSQLLGFSRPGEFKLQERSLGECIQKTVKFIGPVLGKNIEIEVRGEVDDIRMPIDAAQLDHAITNLLINSRDAMPLGGKVSIDFAPQYISCPPISEPQHPAGHYCLITVTDNGIGINPENLKRIFEPFFSTKGLGQGTGLGLAMVCWIVQNHGGWVDVDSILGEGTTIKLFIPMTRSNPAGITQLITKSSRHLEQKKTLMPPSPLGDGVSQSMKKVSS